MATDIKTSVREIVQATPVLDMHTHLYPPAWPLLLWGIDELLTYHYFVGEVLRAAPLPYERFWAMSKREQADYVWRHLFIERSPVSEACRGVVTVLSALGLDPATHDLERCRRALAGVSVEEQVDRVLRLAGVRALVMTNDPFDDAERALWVSSAPCDSRFQAALRIDALFNWPAAAGKLRQWGHAVGDDLGPGEIEAVRAFLREWIERMRPRYLAASLPPTFAYPDAGPAGRLLAEAILSLAAEAHIPFAMMIGVRRQVNPALRLAGDAVGRADVSAIERLCRDFPANRFLVTLLSREDQHELCVAARKFPNLMPFGCWWFLNNPSIIEEITRERVELLGLSFIPQHSDARVLEQLVYKWAHSRRIIADVLADKYADLAAAGWKVTEADIRRDVEALFARNFERFCASA